LRQNKVIATPRTGNMRFFKILALLFELPSLCSFYQIACKNMILIQVWLKTPFAEFA
jgi:hypothetical protein